MAECAPGERGGRINLGGGGREGLGGSFKPVGKGRAFFFWSLKKI